MNVESIKIETDEDGFWLIVDGWVEEIGGDEEEFATEYRFAIADPEALYDHVKAAIGPWLRERDEARTAVARGVTLEEYLRDEYAHERMTGQHVFACDPDESGGNDASDFYSIHADIWDNREGK